MAMIVDLDNLEGNSRKFDLTFKAEELDLAGENIRFGSDVQAVGVIEKDGVRININGTISSDSEADCTRCLSAIKRPLTLDFAVSYLPAEEFALADNSEVEIDELVADMIPPDGLDLKDVVREQIMLSLPTQVFCKVDCEGLCQKCGTNLNLIDCNCEEKEIDPRWAALKDIK